MLERDLITVPVETLEQSQVLVTRGALEATREGAVSCGFVVSAHLSPMAEVSSLDILSLLVPSLKLLRAKPPRVSGADKHYGISW